MGVPIDKAGNAAAVILLYAEYLQQLDPDDIYATTRNELLQALSLLERVIWRDKREP